MLDRISAPAKVRRHAPIELPHVMLLADDPDKTVIEPLTAAADTMEKLYDFDLMQNGGHIRGYKLSDKQVDAWLRHWRPLPPTRPQKKYGVSGVAPLLFAGRRQPLLATAKASSRGAEEGQDLGGVSGAALPVCAGGGGEQPRRRPTVRAYSPGAVRRGSREVHEGISGCLPQRLRGPGARATPLSSCGTARVISSPSLIPRYSWRWVPCRGSSIRT